MAASGWVRLGLPGNAGLVLHDQVAEPAHLEVLHYVGYDDDRGGILSMIRSLAVTGRFRSVLGVNPGFVQKTGRILPTMELSRVDGEKIGLRNFLRAWTVARCIRRWLNEGRARVYHGHSRAGLLVALWLQLMGERRVVVSVHCYGRQRWFYRLAHRWFGERLVWYSPAMKRHYGYDDPTWDGCMPNGVATPLPSSMHRGPGPDGVLRLGGAGAMVPWKRWDLILEALVRLPSSAKVEFTHVGGALNTPESQACEVSLRALTEKLGLQQRVRWQGWQPSSESLLKEVDAIVVPSDGEPFSMIALEAMFAGIPVIATKGGGPDDFIIEGENGWIVSRGDPIALAARMAQCLELRTWSTLRVLPDHLRKFSMIETLAARWGDRYTKLKGVKG
jgi:glycosyltransferase involved in cell wall biosynthesis